jgi:excisionase family DNA binding protein
MTTSPAVYTVSEAAAVLGFNERTFYRMVQAGEFPTVALPGRRCGVPASALGVRRGAPDPSTVLSVPDAAAYLSLRSVRHLWLAVRRGDIRVTPTGAGGVGLRVADLDAWVAGHTRPARPVRAVQHEPSPAA